MLIFRKPLSFKSLQETLGIIFLFVLVHSGCQTTEISHSSAGWGAHEKCQNGQVCSLLRVHHRSLYTVPSHSGRAQGSFKEILILLIFKNTKPNCFPEVPPNIVTFGG